MTRGTLGGDLPLPLSWDGDPRCNGRLSPIGTRLGDCFTAWISTLTRSLPILSRNYRCDAHKHSSISAVGWEVTPSRFAAITRICGRPSSNILASFRSHVGRLPMPVWQKKCGLSARISHEMHCQRALTQYLSPMCCT